jgi:hypothetical protein
MTIPPQFTLDKADESGFGFAGGLARVGAGNRWGYIDRNGKLVWRSPEGEEF